MEVSEDIQTKRLQSVLRHIENVREDCEILGTKLIDEGEVTLGLELIANGLKHDNSKLRGIEWLYMHPDVKLSNEEAFNLACKQHVSTNLHHPEAWVGGIEEMDRLHLGELVCDWRARSSEFGTDFWDWVKYKACKKYKFSPQGKIYKSIKDFGDMLLERKF